MQGSAWLYIPNAGDLMRSLIVVTKRSRTISGVFRHTLARCEFYACSRYKRDWTASGFPSCAHLTTFPLRCWLPKSLSTTFTACYLSIYRTLSLSKLIISILKWLLPRLRRSSLPPLPSVLLLLMPLLPRKNFLFNLMNKRISCT